MSKTKLDPTDESVFWISCNRAIGIADLMSELSTGSNLDESTFRGLGNGLYEDLKIMKEMYQDLLSAYMKET